ncbi:sulfur carrier protein ThiS [Nitrincola tapanii]|jgi:sulfur carrier protein|uniref:Sulfur carrier protein ThiS n=1 Tax=Nitrincola tapanii TaxID=1708751 RepID=A0A5A9W2Y9_9GAMM|nr:sulfur carrier protein ThiS [Nitrincola tapanii]KAA0874475.1 sulfur carrier protein ThiS [Nitrincola tapanii]
MQIYLNGQDHELAADTSLSTLLESMGLAGKRVAVELNLEIVPRSQHATTRLQPGDQVEVVQAIGGG